MKYKFILILLIIIIISPITVIMALAESIDNNILENCVEENEYIKNENNNNNHHENIKKVIKYTVLCIFLLFSSYCVYKTVTFLIYDIPYYPINNQIFNQGILPGQVIHNFMVYRDYLSHCTNGYFGTTVTYESLNFQYIGNLDNIVSHSLTIKYNSVIHNTNFIELNSIGSNNPQLYPIDNFNTINNMRKIYYLKNIFLVNKG